MTCMPDTKTTTSSEALTNLTQTFQVRHLCTFNVAAIFFRKDALIKQNKCTKETGKHTRRLANNLVAFVKEYLRTHAHIVKYNALSNAEVWYKTKTYVSEQGINCWYTQTHVLCYSSHYTHSSHKVAHVSSLLTPRRPLLRECRVQT